MITPRTLFTKKLISWWIFFKAFQNASQGNASSKLKIRTQNSQKSICSRSKIGTLDEGVKYVQS